MSRVEKKSKQLEEKYQQCVDELEISESKLSVYLEHHEGGAGGLKNDLMELSQHEMVDERVRELESENRTLRIKNKEELNTKLLQMESRLKDAQSERDLLKNQYELLEKRKESLEEEVDELKAYIDEVGVGNNFLNTSLS